MKVGRILEPATFGDDLGAVGPVDRSHVPAEPVDRIGEEVEAVENEVGVVDVEIAAAPPSRIVQIERRSSRSRDGRGRIPPSGTDRTTPSVSPSSRPRPARSMRCGIASTLHPERLGQLQDPLRVEIDRLLDQKMPSRRSPPLRDHDGRSAWSLTSSTSG